MNEAAVKMDAMYGVQRHFYDLTRKPYLLGRDTLIRELAPPPSATVLEIGCGTARNLLCIARRYPAARCYGIDVSAAMLQTAGVSIKREGFSRRVRVELADATSFDPSLLFGVGRFDRIVISYALSMIPDWKAVLQRATDLLAPAGALYVVDFGDQAELPNWFRKTLFAWLGCFSVTPRLDLFEQLNNLTRAKDQSCRLRKLYGGYAVLAELRAP
ncbi:MAG TPA: class I SAM-dependent methyltransferase [Verrucomicrobiae bacterium]|jgi:S-adenosylmethionine-diacylgycerolhomoserine-N-methlytransferase|nr:class I SAM-dependent methyltransferase [Verrucomicrobiae bacterium]